MRSNFCTVSLIAIAAMAGSPAFAQSAPPAAEEGGAIVVTGSRIGNSVINSVAPVATVSEEVIAQTGQPNLADILTDMPQIGVGLNDANTQRNATSVGINAINLRRLGAGRTLVLVNGRRQVPGMPLSAAVDLNSIPAALVERVDIVTGGTSAVYGADAVSGVVNVITKRDFEGLEMRATAGITSRGDGESYGLSITGGQNFADGRGNISANVIYDNVEGVQATARSYAVNGINTISNPANTGNNDGIPNFITVPGIRFSGPTHLASTSTSLGNTIFSADGLTSRPYDLGEIGNRSGRTIGGDGGFFEQYDNLSLPIERIGGSVSASFEFSPAARLFVEARIMNSKVLSYWQPVADDFVYAAPSISVDNPFVPQDFAAAAREAGISSFNVYRVYDDYGQRGSDADRLMQQYTAGLEGELFGDWQYEVFGGYGHTRANTQLLNGRQQDRFLESVDVIMLDGQVVCADPDARAAGCAPLNVFNPSSTPDGIAYSLFNDTYRSTVSMLMGGGSVNGTVVDLPAGPLKAAFGIEARENRAKTQPSAALQAGRTYYPQEAPVSGTISVKEAFGELRIPVLADSALGRELTLQAAGRVSDYNINGTHSSWNFGGVYSPFSGLRLRAMRSKSVRAPNVSELFSPANQSFSFVQDPCDVAFRDQTANRAANCAALGIPADFNAPTNGRTTPTRVGGNPQLDVETAYTWTVGAVVQPAFLPGLTLTVDYYDTQIKDAIGSIPIATILNNCVDLPGSPATNPLCDLITRDPVTMGVTNVVATSLNIGALEAQGIDFALSYRTDMAAIAESLPGTIDLSLTGNYLLKLRELTDANNPTSENQREGYLGDPRLQMQSSITWSLDRWAFTLRSRYIQSTDVNGSINIAAGRPADQFDLPKTGSFLINDLSLNYDLTEQSSIRLNVNNLFDVKPPARGANIHQGINEASIYPNLGTTFLAVLSHRF